MTRSLCVLGLATCLLAGCRASDPEPAESDSKHVVHDAGQEEHRLGTMDAVRLEQFLHALDTPVRKIDALEAITREQLVPVERRTDWLCRLDGVLGSSATPWSVQRTPITFDPTLRFVVECWLDDRDPVVRYAAAVCLLDGVPDAGEALDSAAYWLGDEVLAYRGPRPDRGYTLFYDMGADECLVIVGLAAMRWRGAAEDIEDDPPGLTVVEQADGLIRLCGDNMRVWQPRRAQTDWSAGRWQTRLTLLRNPDPRRAQAIAERRIRRSDWPFPEESAMLLGLAPAIETSGMWLPYPAPPYDLAYDRRTRLDGNPWERDREGFTLFDRVAQEIDLRGLGSDALPVLLAYAHGDATPHAKRRAHEVLRELGPEAVPAVLRGSETYSDSQAYLDLLLALGRETIPELVALLKDDDPGVRAGAARGLAYWGPFASEAAEALRDAARAEDDAYAKAQAHRALAAVQAKRE